MHLHEYQTKDLLGSYRIPIPPFITASTLEEVEKGIETLQLTEAVLKIQVHAGGRGKAGGVKLAKGKQEILAVAKQLLGMRMVGSQTGPEGVIATKIMVTPVISIEKEYYLSVVIDRGLGSIVVMVSSEGGMEIEAHPEKIHKVKAELSGKMRAFEIRRLIRLLGWEGAVAKEGQRIVESLVQAFIEKDASLIEINPLVLSEGKLWVLDAKCTIDDNALFRQKDLAKLYDPAQHSKAEVQAKEADLSYVSMEGNIGCMVNGAGLAMATMDLIHLYGGKPANFLDVGGSASKEKIVKGCQIILEDPKVKVVLVNIFGGIMDCALLAEALVEAFSFLSIDLPFVVRMEGTNVEKGKKILEDSKQPIVIVDALETAAETAVSLLKR